MTTREEMIDRVMRCIDRPPSRYAAFVADFALSVERAAFERAADMARNARTWSELDGQLDALARLRAADLLRSRAAPPEPPDVFEAFAGAAWSASHNPGTDADRRGAIADVMRESFGPLVEIAEDLKLASYDPHGGFARVSVALTIKAQNALAALRERAKESSGG